MTTDVIVVGAGPAGSASALLLARRGYHVTLLDRARFPRPKPCGEYLNPGAVAALDSLGVGQLVATQGLGLSGVRVLDLDGHAIRAPFATGRALLVCRTTLDHVLLGEAARAGAQVIEGFRADAVIPGAVPSVTGWHNGRILRLEAKLVIGADGLRSVTARHAGGLAPARNGHYSVGARFEISGPAAPGLTLHLGHAWFVGSAFYGDGTGNVVASFPRDAFRRAHVRIPELFNRACAQLPALRDIMRRAKPITSFTTVGPLGYTRRPVVNDGLLLVGDAAGTVSPMTGEGIALALRGAIIAAQTADKVLQNGPASRHALRSYEHERTAAFRDTWRVSRILQWIVRQPRLAAYLVGNLADEPNLASILLEVVAGSRRARDVLSPSFVTRIVLPRR